MNGGMSPISLLPCKSRYVSSLRDASWLGTVPSKLLKAAPKPVTDSASRWLKDQEDVFTLSCRKEALPSAYVMLALKYPGTARRARDRSPGLCCTPLGKESGPVFVLGPRLPTPKLLMRWAAAPLPKPLLVPAANSAAASVKDRQATSSTRRYTVGIPPRRRASPIIAPSLSRDCMLREGAPRLSISCQARPVSDTPSHRSASRRPAAPTQPFGMSPWCAKNLLPFSYRSKVVPSRPKVKGDGEGTHSLTCSCHRSLDSFRLFSLGNKPGSTQSTLAAISRGPGLPGQGGDGGARTPNTTRQGYRLRAAKPAYGRDSLVVGQEVKGRFAFDFIAAESESTAMHTRSIGE